MTGTTTMDRMRLIRAHLEATSRGRSPSPEQVGIWLKELEEILNVKKQKAELPLKVLNMEMMHSIKWKKERRI